MKEEQGSMEVNKLISALKNICLSIISFAIALFIGEILLRMNRGVRVFDFTHPVLYGIKTKAGTADSYMFNYAKLMDIDKHFYAFEPKPESYGVYRNESKTLVENYDGGDESNELLKQWNYNFLKRIPSYQPEDSTKLLTAYRDGRLYAFDSPDTGIYPLFRYFSNSTLPHQTVRFNKWGLGGTDVDLKKQKNKIRIAFLGASTTQQLFFCDFAYPDYIKEWLNQWSKEKGLNVEFEVINAGRVGQRSMDMAAISKYEIAPFQPDFVIYYEGNNQFFPFDLYDFGAEGKSFDSDPTYRFVGRSVILQKLLNLAGYNYLAAIEREKPVVKRNWPQCMFQNPPNPYDKTLPLELPQIVKDLDTISASLDTAYQTLVLCSYAMVAGDTILKKPDYASVYSYWLTLQGKVPLKDIREANAFENKVFKRYSELNGHVFIDVADELARHPDLFRDGIHLSCDGIKLHAWIVFTHLLPIIEAQIKSGKLPHSRDLKCPEHPYIKDKPFLVDLHKLWGNNTLIKQGL